MWLQTPVFRVVRVSLGKARSENTLDATKSGYSLVSRLIFNFGKHKGRAVKEVLKAEPQYYDWMMRGDFPLHTKQKLTEILNRTLLKNI